MNYFKAHKCSMETGLPAASINTFLLVTSETSISVNSQILWTASSYSLFGVKLYLVLNSETKMFILLAPSTYNGSYV